MSPSPQLCTASKTLALAVSSTKPLRCSNSSFPSPSFSLSGWVLCLKSLARINWWKSRSTGMTVVPLTGVLGHMASSGQCRSSYQYNSFSLVYVFVVLFTWPPLHYLSSLRLLPRVAISIKIGLPFEHQNRFSISMVLGQYQLLKISIPKHK